MIAVALQTLIGTGLLTLALAARSDGSSVFNTIPSQNQITPQSPAGIVADDARWLEQLKSSDVEKRREAVMELSHIAGTAATSALLSAMADPSSRVRAAAAAGIAERGDAHAASVLAACVTKDKDAFVRKMAAYSLGNFRGDERTAALIAAMRDKEAEVRGAAAVSLGAYPEPGALEALTSALSDRNAFVRAHAARALGVNGNAARQAVSQLSKMVTTDEDGEVRRQAATALGLIGDREALPALELARHNRDPHLAEAAIESIKLIDKK